MIFDTTKYLPNEPKDGHAEFALAHIPGARFFDIDDIADPDTDLPHMVPSAGLFGRKLAPPWAHVFAALGAQRFSGWMVVEQDIFPQAPERFAQAIADQHLNRQFLAARGL